MVVHSFVQREKGKNDNKKEYGFFTSVVLVHLK